MRDDTLIPSDHAVERLLAARVAHGDSPHTVRALRGDLDEGKVEYETHPIFNMKMPKSCPGVDAKILNPRNTWSDKAAYDAAAVKLRDMFRKNFEEKGFARLGIEQVM